MISFWWSTDLALNITVERAQIVLFLTTNKSGCTYWTYFLNYSVMDCISKLNDINKKHWFLDPSGKRKASFHTKQYTTDTYGEQKDDNRTRNLPYTSLDHFTETLKYIIKVFAEMFFLFKYIQRETTGENLFSINSCNHRPWFWLPFLRILPSIYLINYIKCVFYLKQSEHLLQKANNLFRCSSYFPRRMKDKR